MAPPTKKQKTGDGDANSPIVFPCAGQKPDVRLIVFKQAFHVHSTLLKLNTAFFRKFLDSADKAVNLPNGEGGSGGLGGLTPPEASQIGFDSTLGMTFKYEWVTKIDEGGEKWCLVSDDPKNEPYDLSTYQGDIKAETTTFEKLLCAIYTRPYQIEGAKELLLLTDLADYYRALPILSRTLDGALINSPMLCGNIQHSATELFVAAAKLRNPLLFRECLIWIVGPHRKPAFHDLQDSRLRMVARCIHGDISTKAMSAIHRMLRRGADDWADKWSEKSEVAMFSDLYAQSTSHDPYGVDAAWYLRTVSNSFYSVLNHFDVYELLSSKLVLDNGFHEAGRGDHKDFFFCAEISDEDLPWDASETDW
ncbi:hypothetical protein BDZ45DRAFT_668679 [Acephala macrosclerotiorum]|nr:hypothetical protein BDZ45DRAFT_668679 [Acephala macrosclerotiorum]